jgi:hypothetical protein
MNTTSSRDTIHHFIAALRRYVFDLTAAMGLPASWTGMHQFLGKSWKGDVPRSGAVGGIEYTVHGRIGCRMQAPEGGLVDVEVLSNGALAFDAWRIWQFAASLDGMPPDVADVELACDELVVEGVLERPKDRWFALIEGERES